MKEIKLTKGQVAIIDDDDYERVSKLKWYASEAKHKGSKEYYARHKYTESLGVYKTIYLHHFIAGKPRRPLVVEHINGNTLDNRKENLRIVIRHRVALNCHTGTVRSGVYWEKQCQQWLARIWINGKRKYLGISKDRDEAIKIYMAAVKKYEKTKGLWFRPKSGQYFAL